MGSKKKLSGSVRGQKFELADFLPTRQDYFELLLKNKTPSERLLLSRYFWSCPSVTVVGQRWI